MMFMNGRYNRQGCRGNNLYFVRFEVFMVMTMKNIVFWDVARCPSGYQIHTVLQPRRQYSSIYTLLQGTCLGRLINPKN
jgi:hypothetical protein